VGLRSLGKLALMARKPPARKTPRVLILLLLLATVGLFAAVYHKKIRRLELEAARPGEIELVNIGGVSTQVMSLKVGEDEEIDKSLDHQTILMSAAAQKTPAPIVQTNPKVRANVDEYEVEAVRKAYEEFARTNVNRPAEKIVLD
jgi:hypothetical protein